MKKITKKSLFLSMCVALSTLAQAQTTIPNGNFEAWQNVGSNTEEPTNWSGNKTGGGNATLGPQTCFREGTNPHTGTYCVKLDNASFFGTPVNATVTTGRIEAPTTNPLDGYIRTMTTNADYNSPFTGRPDSLVGWYRYTQGGTDMGRIYAIVHDSFNVSNPDQGGSATHIVAEALFDLPNGNAATWTRFAVPFTYTGNGAAPRYILLIATASRVAGVANASTLMWVDDLEAVYCTNATTSLTEIACGSYTSPSGKVFTTSGVHMDTLFSVHGVSGDCDSIFTINLTINNADASVTDNGNSLTANAVGAGYQWLDCNNGFAPISGETNATFTPTVSGDYAVEVTENGCTEMSNCFNVVVSGIEELAFNNNLSVYPNPTTGQFTVDLGGNYNDVNLTVTDLSGKTIHNAVYNQSSKIQLDLNQPAGLYIVTVTSGNKHAVAKLFFN